MEGRGRGGVGQTDSRFNSGISWAETTQNGENRIYTESVKNTETTFIMGKGGKEDSGEKNDTYIIGGRET